MELRDFIVTPIIIIIVYIAAWIIRPLVTDSISVRYFLPALTVKIIGALALGLVYQFHYDGGDTFNYHTFGSRVIWDAFVENPAAGLKLIFYPGTYADPSVYRYASKILFYQDPSSYLIVRIAAFIDLFTFSSYSATAVVFAVMSFTGSWFFFLTFYQYRPHLYRRIAICAFFIPSVAFWGSGVLKDSIILAALGMLTYEIRKLLIDKNVTLRSVLLLLLTALTIYAIKKYVLLCFLPAALFWVYAGNLSRVRSAMVKILFVPLVLLVSAFSGYFAVMKVGENDPRYALDQLAHTARITAYDIGFYSGKNAGSGYTLGELDDSFGSLLKLAPQAINVSLFRPWIWEVKNVLMLMASLESLALLVITGGLFFYRPLNFMRSLLDPAILFCLIFSVTFAFAVGVSTFNFGTLARYKIPLLPFYAMALTLIADRSIRVKKVAVLERTE